MSTLAGNQPKGTGGYDLTRLEDQRAFAAHLLVTERRRELWQRAKVGLVWVALFALLGYLLHLLNVDFAYAIANSGFVLEGIWTTLGVSFASIAIATILALIGALGRLSPHARCRPCGRPPACPYRRRRPAWRCRAALPGAPRRAQ